MKVVVAMDSFKGSLTSLEAGCAAKEGICRAIQDAEVCVMPLADGGEGTVEALTLGRGRKEIVTVTGPLGAPVECSYGILESECAVIEISSAAGLTLIPQEARNPLDATTYGVGEVIKDAINKGCRSFIVGLGGSATNDGGIGMLQALGFGMLDKDGKQVKMGAKGLKELRAITNENALPQLKECTFRIACDVNNPLCGERGASAVFGPQKGANGDAVRDMDAWLQSYANLAAEQYVGADPTKAGAGAAGGLGFAFMAFLNATMESGVKLVIEETGLEEKVKDAEIVVTGEGRLDGQSVMGKAPVGVAQLAKKYQKPVLAFCGSAAEDADLCLSAGIDAYFPIVQEVVDLKTAMKPTVAKRNLTAAAEQVFRLIKQIRGN